MLAIALLALGAPASGMAATPTPGNSEVNQYTETLPGPTGDNTVDPPSAAKPGDSTLPSGTKKELEEFGPDGVAAAGLAEANAPELPIAANSGHGGTAGTAGDAAGAADDAKADSAVKGVLEALTGSSGDGLGAFLVLILAAVAAMGIGHLLLRRARQAG